MDRFWRIYTGFTKWLLGFSLAIVALGGLIGALLELQKSSGQFISYQGLTLFILSLLAFNTAWNVLPLENATAPQQRPQDLNARLQSLTEALTTAGNVISEIESEIQGRQELVGKLERQKIIAERAIELSKEQVDAVSALLSEQVARQGKTDFRRELAKDFIFFILGVMAIPVLRWLGVAI